MAVEIGAANFKKPIYSKDKYNIIYLKLIQ